MDSSFELVYINLDDRVDKREVTEINLTEYGLGGKNFKRFSAVREVDIPALGCSKSHYMAIANFVVYSKKEFVFIIEDDWRFSVQISEIERYVELLYRNNPEFKVLLLSATDALSSDNGIIKLDERVNAVPILKSTSTAAYVLNRKYALELNSIFSKSIERIARNSKEIVDINRDYYSKNGNKDKDVVSKKVAVNVLTALDHVWGELSINGGFYSLNYRVGFCDELSSDISGYSINNADRQFAKKRAI